MREVASLCDTLLRAPTQLLWIPGDLRLSRTSETHPEGISGAASDSKSPSPDRDAFGTPKAAGDLSPAEVRGWVEDAVAEAGLSRERAERLAPQLGDARIRELLCEGAQQIKRATTGRRVTVSRNIFIPLTNLCRNRCSYCTFAKQPDSAEAHTYTVEEVEDVVRGGVATGCIEALMCLGDKPEIAYGSYREMLETRGLSSTTDLLVEACRVTLEKGMLPHTNAGILTRDEMERLRPFNASMGLMLETTSQRLRQKGMPHYYAPDKEPARRIQMHEEAGELKIPFTSGILLGIGENDAERVDTLFTIRDLSLRYGHIQEAIIQASSSAQREVASRYGPDGSPSPTLRKSPAAAGAPVRDPRAGLTAFDIVSKGAHGHPAASARPRAPG